MGTEEEQSPDFFFSQSSTVEVSFELLVNASYWLTEFLQKQEQQQQQGNNETHTDKKWLEEFGMKRVPCPSALILKRFNV